LLTTFTLTVQVAAPAGTAAPLTVMVPLVLTAVIVGVPQPVLETPLGVAIITPAGKVSTKPKPLVASPLARLVMEKVRALGTPIPTDVGLKALVSVGFATTVKPLFATALVMRARPEIFVAPLIYGPPTAVLVTFTCTWQLATAAFIARPLTAIVPLPAAAVTKAGLAVNAPPAGQLLWIAGVAATVTLVGNVSTKLIPD
jgi:hypothetical protein